MLSFWGFNYSHLACFFGPVMAEYIVGVGYAVEKAAHYIAAWKLRVG